MKDRLSLFLGVMIGWATAAVVVAIIAGTIAYTRVPAATVDFEGSGGSSVEDTESTADAATVVPVRVRSFECMMCDRMTADDIQCKEEGFDEAHQQRVAEYCIPCWRGVLADLREARGVLLSEGDN